MLTPTAARSAQRTITSCNSLIGSSATPARSLPLVIRQRRHSSSKHSSTPKQTSAPPTSSPKQGSSGVPKKKAAKSKAQKDNSEKQVAAETQQDQSVQPPSVPSTAHIDPKVVYLASLFAQHRPISLNQPVPPQDNQKTFEAIFAPRVYKNKPKDVIFTLASAVKQLEGSASGNAALDNGLSQPALNLEDLAKTFRPFNAPPAPVPMDPEFAEERITTPAVTFGVEEPPMPEGVAAEIMDKPDAERAVQAPFRERMRVRQETWLSRWIRTFREQWNLISVKRQRRVKMKKHKYKKLMRRTRNLRRRQDRL